MLALVTGGSGFVGSRLVRRLVDRGDEVRVLALPETVADVPALDGVTTCVGSLEQFPQDIADDVEVVYHLAWAMQPDTPDVADANVFGTEGLVDACKRSRVPRLVFVSSVAAYEPQSSRSGPIDERGRLRRETSEASGAAAYGAAKIRAERAVSAATGHVILRSTAAYDAESEWVAQLLEALIDRPVAVHRASPRWPPIQWVHVSDLVEAIALGGTRRAACDGVFNVAGLSTVSLAGLRRMALDLRGLRRGPAQSSGSSAYDCSNARRVLGYEPRISLRAGLEPILAPT